MKRYTKLFSLLFAAILLFSALLPAAASADTQLYITKNLPSTYNVQANQQVTFNVAASGGDGSLAFMWYSSKGPITDSNGNYVTTDSITFTVSSSDKLWCVITSGDQFVISTQCQLNVIGGSAVTPAPTSNVPLNPNAPVSKPKIVTQPVSVAVPLGQTKALSVAASHEWYGLGLDLKYQWYKSTVKDAKYASPISGANSPTYNVPPAYQAGTVYYIVAVSTTNGMQDSELVYSNMVSVKYGADSVLEVTKHPTSETVNEGGQATFIAHADGATKHEWRFLPANYNTNQFLTAKNLTSVFNGVSVIGADGDTLVLKNIPFAMNGMKVFCVYYETPQKFVITNSATVFVKQTVTQTPAYNGQNGSTVNGNTGSTGNTGNNSGAGNTGAGSGSGTTFIPGVTNAIVTPTITVQPEGAVLEEGKNTVLSVSAASDNAAGVQIKYQWYKNDKNSNVNGAAIAGAQSSSYTPETISGTKYYYVGVWATDNSKNSKVVYSSPVAVTYTAAATPSPTVAPTATPAPVNNSGNKSLLSQLALPLIAMLVTVAVAIGAFIMLKKVNTRDDGNYRGRDYGSKYDDDDKY